jgi:hypothetical protein
MTLPSPCTIGAAHATPGVPAAEATLLAGPDVNAGGVDERGDAAEDSEQGGRLLCHEEDGNEDADERAQALEGRIEQHAEGEASQSVDLPDACDAANAGGATEGRRVPGGEASGGRGVADGRCCGHAGHVLHSPREAALLDILSINTHCVHE